MKKPTARSIGVLLVVLTLSACGATTRSEATSTPEAAKPEAAADTGAIMFDATGMNLQAAQDKVQADLDIWYSDSVDATGQDRMQINDSNWTVVRQTPAAGTPVNDDTDITFYVTK